MANRADSLDRHCAFELKRPDRFPILDIGCQFTGDVDEQLPNCSEELIEYKGCFWCPFHLPSDYWHENERDRSLLGRRISDKIIELAKSFRSDDAYYPLDLTGIIFPTDVRFENISFGSVILRKCDFMDHVTFKDCGFKHYVHFDQSIFRQHTNFFDCRFKNELVFSDARFVSNLRIAKTRIVAIRAHDAEFHEPARFSNFSIDGSFDFSSSKFFKDLRFSRLENVNEILLIRAEISNGISIHDCPAAHVSLAKAKLLGRANFINQEFSSLSLHDATFGDAQDVSMGPPDTRSRRAGPPDWAHSPKHSLYESRASLFFNEATFRGAADFSASYSIGQEPEAIFPQISFKDAAFLSNVSFDNRRFGSATSFQGAEFSFAPSFHNCALHQGTSFYRAKFLDYKRIKRLPLAERTDDAEIATRAFRTLKLASESVRARQEQADFFAEEERRNRLDPDSSTLVVFASWLYEITSDYGRSFLRPALWWLAVQVIFFLIYMKILAEGMPTRLDIVAVMRLTLQQIFRPFEFFGLRVEPTELEETYLRGLSTDISQVPILILGILGVFQSILAVSLLALFLFALRRRFKLD